MGISDASKQGDKPRVVILNDTSQRNHHGCSRVMRLLKNGLTDRGMEISATSLARNDWENDPAFLAHLKDASLIVINGEGTLHHGRDAGAKLLEIVDRPEAEGCPTALVNALYQENPKSWGNWVSKFDLVSTRDRKSAAEVKDTTGRNDISVVPDLSLSAGAVIAEKKRMGIVFGDSVKWKIRRYLAQSAIRLRAGTFLPTKTVPKWLITTPIIGRFVFTVYNGTFVFRMPKFQVANNEEEYLGMLAHSEMHVTGRFHAICLSMITGTPFLAVGSNSWKIEQLLDEAGLGTSRIVSTEGLEVMTAKDLEKPFTNTESQKIAEFLESAVVKSDALFDDLASLAKRERR